MKRALFHRRMREILTIALAAAPSACCSVEESQTRMVESAEFRWGDRTCESVCLGSVGCPGSPRVVSCSFEGSAPARTAVCVIESTDCPRAPGPWGDCGRRHQGASPPEVRAHGAAEVLAHMALLERESVPAFERLADELAAHGAPASMVRDARRAADDERMHARVMTRLARRAGATVPTWRPTRGAVRPLRAIAEENAREGCVRETLGALVAGWQARRAIDPRVRAALAVIARDETRHAALAWRVDAWARSRLSADEGAALDAARDDAVRALRGEARRPGAAACRELGIPRGDALRALIEGCAQGLWRGSRA